MTKQEYDIRKIPVSSIVFDGAFDRAIVASFMKYLVTNLVTRGLGVIEVADNHDGTFTSLEGKHRVESVKDKWGPNVLVDAKVWHNLSQEERAAQFRLLNKRLKVTAYAGFHAAETERVPEVTDIISILAKHGLTYASSPTTNSVACVSQLEMIYSRLGREVLDETLALVVGAWGHQAAAYDGQIIAGLGTFVGRYRGSYDFEILRRKLAKYPGGCDGFLGMAKNYKTVHLGSVARAVAGLTVDIYNFRRGKGQLPAWS